MFRKWEGELDTLDYEKLEAAYEDAKFGTQAPDAMILWPNGARYLLRRFNPEMTDEEIEKRIDELFPRYAPGSVDADEEV